MSEDNYSLSSRVFHTIRENILSGKYATDEELKEKSIGEELGVSRTPVREALRQLELEGLVTIIPNKGAYVVGISQKDIRDIYEIRSRLEGLCARWACDNITKDQLDELEENIYLSVFILPREIPSRWWSSTTSSMKFYTMRQAARNCATSCGIFSHYVQRVRKVTLAVQERAVNSNEEHRKIVEALKQHDGARAEELADAHMRNTINNMDHYGWDNLLKQ